MNQQKLEDLRQALNAMNCKEPDPNVEAVRQRLADRAAFGLAKYGTDTTRSDLTRIEWLRHAQDEALDLSVYLERLISKEMLSCHWVHDDADSEFETQCGQRFTLNEGTPEENKLEFCPFCGGSLTVDRCAEDGE
jgi:hypothetical protein